MYTLKLELADNGVVKTVVDDNYNGAGGKMERKIVYDFTDDENNKFVKTREFIESLCVDLSITRGNKYSDSTLKITNGPGDNYVPTKEDCESTIKALQSDIRKYRAILKELS